MDFWRNHGRIEHVRFVDEPKVTDGRLAFAVEERYLAPDGKEFCRGIDAFTIVPMERSHGTLLMWAVTLKAGAKPLVFGPQHEMGLGFRIATPLIVDGGSGHIVGSHGGWDEAGNWGRPGTWWDYSGSIVDRHAGILAVAASDNPRPVWPHSRDYGFLAMNPAGPPEGGDDTPSIPFSVEAGEKLRLKFGILLRSSPRSSPTDPKEAARLVEAELEKWQSETKQP